MNLILVHLKSSELTFFSMLHVKMSSLRSNYLVLKLLFAFMGEYSVIIMLTKSVVTASVSPTVSQPVSRNWYRNFLRSRQGRRVLSTLLQDDVDHNRYITAVSPYEKRKKSPHQLVLDNV